MRIKISIALLQLNQATMVIASLQLQLMKMAFGTVFGWMFYSLIRTLLLEQ